MRHTILATAVLAIAGPVLHAQSIDDKQEMKQSEKRLADAVDTMNASCGTKISASYDWASSYVAGKPPADRRWLGGPRFCASIVDGIADLCTEPEAKPVIAAKLRALRCKYEAGIGTKKELEPRGGPLLRLDGSTLHASFDFITVNIMAETRSWLRKNL